MNRNNSFSQILSRIIGSASTKTMQGQLLKASLLDSPLGPMITIASEEALYLLEFVDRVNLEHEVEQLKSRTKSTIIPGSSPPIVSIEKELHQYFNGELQNFTTPTFYLGTPFQVRVWDELKKIPWGNTCSYKDIALAIERPTACRAVAHAIATNHLAIIIPCHRVITINGKSGSYSGGLVRKCWLINHEKKKQYT